MLFVSLKSAFGQNFMLSLRIEMMAQKKQDIYSAQSSARQTEINARVKSVSAWMKNCWHTIIYTFYSCESFLRFFLLLFLRSTNSFWGLWCLCCCLLDVLFEICTHANLFIFIWGNESHHRMILTSFSRFVELKWMSKWEWFCEFMNFHTTYFKDYLMILFWLVKWFG